MQLSKFFQKKVLYSQGEQLLSIEKWKIFHHHSHEKRGTVARCVSQECVCAECHGLRSHPRGQSEHRPDRRESTAVLSREDPELHGVPTWPGAQPGHPRVTRRAHRLPVWALYSGELSVARRAGGELRRRRCRRGLRTAGTALLYVRCRQA